MGVPDEMSDSGDAPPRKRSRLSLNKSQTEKSSHSQLQTPKKNQDKVTICGEKHQKDVQLQLPMAWRKKESTTKPGNCSVKSLSPEPDDIGPHEKRTKR